MVEQGRVDVVADGTDDRSAGCGDDAHECFVAERQEVFEGAAAARDDDHVDVVDLVEFADGTADLLHRVGALDGDLPNLEACCGPSSASVLDDVVLCGTRSAGDQPDAAGEERKGLLAVAVEDAFGRERSLELLETEQQFALADGTHDATLEHELATFRPERRFRVDDDSRPLAHERPHRVERVRRDGER